MKEYAVIIYFSLCSFFAIAGSYDQYVNQVFIANNATLVRLQASDSGVTQTVLGNLADVMEWATHMPASDDEIEFEATCRIDSAYLVDMDSSGTAYAAFDKSIFSFDGKQANIQRVESERRIIDLAAGTTTAYCLLCAPDRTSIAVINKQLELTPVAIPAVDGLRLKSLAITKDENYYAFVTQENTVKVLNAFENFKVQLETSGSAVQFMNDIVFIKNPEETLWTTISLDSMEFKGSLESDGFTISLDGSLAFAWDPFVVFSSKRAVALRPLKEGDMVHAAAFTYDNNGLFVLSSSQPGLADGDYYYKLCLRYFNLLLSDEVGSVIWEEQVPHRIGFSMWTLPPRNDQ